MSPHANANKRDVISNNDNHRTLFYPPPLKINKDSHSIKKSSPSSSSGSPSSSASSSTPSLMNAVAGAKPAQQQRHPVIIYTHSPKIIHTHPRDFMALVQKLTGRSRFEDDARQPRPQPPPPSKKREVNVDGLLEEEIMNNNRIAGKVMMRNEDNDSSSVITTEENCSSTNINSNDINNNNNNNNVGVGSVVGVGGEGGGGGGGGGGGDGQVSSCFMLPNPYIGNIPVITPKAADFLCSNSINHLFTTI
ncbi:hypothetical protein ACFX2I_015778 [Malus domestica]